MYVVKTVNPKQNIVCTLYDMILDMTVQITVFKFLQYFFVMLLQYFIRCVYYISSFLLDYTFVSTKT